MRNIKQINNKTSHEQLVIDPAPTSVIVGYDEQRNPIYNDVYYATINIANSVHKIGYCADNCSIQYPIYINGKGIYPGKTGMYEQQNENIDAEKPSDIINILNLNNGGTIRLPYGTTIDEPFNFTFDYVVTA